MPLSTKDNILPLICISGKWLENAGFITGNEVSVQVKGQRELVIKFIPDTEIKEACFEGKDICDIRYNCQR
jgi:hypothetical protein